MSRKLITRYNIKLGDSLSSWKTKTHNTISRSSTEVEYKSMADTIAELVWLSGLLRELQIDLQLHMDLYCDNKATL